MEIKLYPHNQETYNKIQEMWKTTNRVAAIQPTGSGKSFLILKCLFDYVDKNKVVLSPSNYIFEQLIQHSDEVIPNVEFITYSKITNITDEEIKVLNPALIVLDEFHRCGAEQWGKGVQKLLEAYPNAKVLGTSATPIRYLDNERDMSDELFEGNIAVNMSLSEAIVKGILPMPKYISALYTFDDEINNLRDKVNKSHNSNEEKEELLKQIDIMKNKLNKSKGIPEIFKKYLTVSDDKFIIFCKNKEHLDEMKPIVVGWFKKSGLKNIKTYTVYTGYKDTDIEFESFKNDNDDSIKLLFSIEMLNEGIHVEGVKGVILLRPTISPIIYYQQIGRAIDAGNTNEPLIFDFVNNFDNIGAKQFIVDLKEARQKEIYARKEYEHKDDFDIPEFKIIDEIIEVKELFNNIRNQLFDSWDNMYKQLIEFNKEHKHNNVPQTGFYQKLGKWCSQQRILFKNSRLSNERINKLELINFCWDILDEQWMNNYQVFKEYIEQYNNVTPPLRFIFNGINIGLWVSVQRQKFKKKVMSQKRINMLNDIGFIWNTLDYNWIYNYNNLRDFYLENGHTNVLVSDNEKLGKWVYTQRFLYKQNKLSLERINQLKILNFNFDSTFDANEWNEMYQLLKKYYIQNNTTNVLKSDNPKLYNWVLTQRKAFKNNNISQDKIDKLNNLNFIWDIDNNAWNEMFEELIKYKQNTGNTTVPLRYILNNKLGRWVNNQRQNYIKGKLSKEKIDKLNSIGFEWSLKDKKEENS